MRAVVVAMLAACLPGESFAHAFLKAASPAVGSTVARAPATVAIEFTEGIEPLFSTIAVTDAAGARVDHGGDRLDGDPARLAVSVGPLAPGRYEVVWHATAVDTHKTEGRFAFTVGAGG